MTQRLKGKSARVTGSPPQAGAITDRADNASKPAVRQPIGWVTGITCLLLALAVWVVFGQTLHHEFVNYDDDRYVYENSTITQGLNRSGIAWAFTHSHGDNWHPLTSLSHMLDCQFYGLKPGGHHLTNVLLHAATAIVLLLVFRNLTGAFWPSAFVAAVFALHPLRVESVAWVAERKDVLSGLFFALTLGAYVRYVRRSETGRSHAGGNHTRSHLRLLTSKDYWLVLLLFALGLLSKPMLVTLPFVLLLLDYWPLGRMRRGSPTNVELKRFENHLGPNPATFRQLMIEKIPFLLLSAASCVATILAQESAIRSVQNLSFLSRIGNALVACAVYIGQMFYPSGLAVLYPHPGNQLSVWTVGLCGVVLIFLSVSAVKWQRKRPYLLVGWLWYLGMLVPVIGFLQVGSHARADRYTYLPHLGLYVMVAWGAVDLCGAWRVCRAMLPAAAVVILTGLLVLAHIQTRHWRDSVSLWAHTLACTSGNFFAHNNLGNALAERGKLNAAIPHYERALQLKPSYAEAHINLGVALAQLGKWNAAIPEFEQALQLKPDSAEAHSNLGVALTQQGKWNAAVPHYERALQLKPDSAEVHNNLGLALVKQGMWHEAIPHYERALQLKPYYIEAGYNLAWLLATCIEAQFRNPAEALRLAQRARELTQSRSPEVLDALAAAQAASGDFGRAVVTAKQALALATAAAHPVLAQEIQGRLHLYQAGQPFYESSPDGRQKTP